VKITKNEGEEENHNIVGLSEERAWIEGGRKA